LLPELSHLVEHIEFPSLGEELLRGFVLANELWKSIVIFSLLLNFFIVIIDQTFNNNLLSLSRVINLI